MEELIDLIATDAPAVEITDTIKDVLYAKAAERLNDIKPYVANAMFGASEE
jgi:hypothetical protein